MEKQGDEERGEVAGAQVEHIPKNIKRGKINLINLYF